MEQTLETTANQNGVVDPAANPNGTQPNKPADLVTRVSGYKSPETQPTNNDGVTKGFDINAELAKIQDPAQRQIVETSYKNMLAHTNKNNEEAVRLKKDYESKIAQTNAPWTAERIQGLLNDPNFVNAASQVANAKSPKSDNGDVDYSLLSDSEKAKLSQMEAELNALKTQSYFALKTQQDTQLQSKYANYKSEAVDITTADMLAGKVQATREHIWKAIDYDDAVTRAYNLGKEDGTKGRNERVNSSSYSTQTNMQTQNGEKPPPDKQISGREQFRQIALKNLLAFREGRLKG